MVYKPELTISIVNTNNCALLKGCIESIYRSTNLSDFEIIVVDNFSSDGSVEMLRNEFPSVKVVENKEKRGYGDSHNRGIAEANGEFILIFNEDMVVLPGAIDKMLRKINEDRTIGALSCRILNPDGSLQHSCSRFPSLRRRLFEEIFPRNIVFQNSRHRGKMFEWNHDEEREVDIVVGCCILSPKRVIEEVGLFDPQFFVYSEEDDLCRRIRNRGYKILFTPGAEIIHVGGQTSKGMSVKMSLVMTESKFKYLKKHHGGLVGSMYKVVAGLGAIIRLIGWSGYWVLNGKKRQEAKGMIVRYAKTLALLTGMIKP